MKKYNVTGKTKELLIQTAGKLFSEYGIAGVSVRQIAEAAGTVQNAITYHFGGKGGLVEAVWSKALEKWDTTALKRYCMENAHLFRTKDGLRQAVRDSVDMIFSLLASEEQPAWISRFLVQVALMNPEGREHVRKLVVYLEELFKKVSGNSDGETAQCWGFNILCSAAMAAANAAAFTDFVRNGKIAPDFYRRLKETTLRNALFGAGLA